MSGLYLQPCAARQGQGLQLFVYGAPGLYMKGYVTPQLFTPPPPPNLNGTDIQPKLQCH